jgi:hypothetical protein
MQTAYTGQANILELPVVAKANGDPITAGTVNLYLVAKEGVNANKWYRGSDQTWQVAESIAGEATHRANGHWYLSFPDAVWTLSIRYRLYAKEDGDLHITVGEDVIAKGGLAAIADAIHDEIVEGTMTLRQAIRLILAVLTAKSSGGGTTTNTFRDIGDTKDRLEVTVDSDGNRTAVGTRDGT